MFMLSWWSQCFMDWMRIRGRWGLSMGLTGLWLLIPIQTLSSLSSLLLWPSSITRGQTLSQSRSQSSATSGGQIIEEIKVILVRSNLLTFLALCQDTAPPSLSLVTLESSWSSGPSLCSSLPQVVDNYVISAGQSNRWWLACPTLRLQNYTIGLHMTQTPPDAAFLAFSKVAS